MGTGQDWLTKDELETLESSSWFDPESKRLLANGLGYANPASLFHGSAGMVNLLSLAGPGVSHDIQRALNVRNLQRKKPITKEQADYLDHKGFYLPEPRRIWSKPAARPRTPLAEQLADGLGWPAVVELVALLDFYCMVSFALNAFGVPLPEGVASVWKR